VDHVFFCKGIFDGLSDKAENQSAIVCKDGKIERILPVDSLSSLAYEKGAKIDASDWMAIPGLIDSHVHLAGNIEEQLLFDDSDPSVATIQAIQNAQAALSAGLTTVRDCGSPGKSVLALRNAVRAGRANGPDIFTSGPPLTTTGGHLPNISLSVDGVQEVKKAVRYLAKMGVDFIKACVTGGGGTPGTNIFVSHFDPSELKAMCDEAHRLELKVAAHLHGTEGIKMALDAGVDFLEHSSWVTHAGVAIDEGVAEKMRERAACVSLTLGVLNRRPTSKLRPELDRVWGEYRAKSLGIVKKMKAMGIALILGTDAGTWKTPIDLMYMALEDLVQGAGFKPAEALRTATSISAKALGYEDRGTLVPGKRADIVFVDGDPLKDISVAGRVMMTVVNGRIAYKRKSESDAGS
jgi:imidazolonepropionase-like amidohydrolase